MGRAQREGSVRLSVTLRTTAHDELARIAEKKRVSTAWVVREAVERYLEAEMPLFWRPENADKPTGV
jgi:predicted transcriptional regulator